MPKRRQTWIISDQQKAKNKRKKWSLRGSLLTAVMVVIGLVGSVLGISTAMADTGSPFPTTAPAGQVCKDIDGVNTCVNEAQASETKPKTVTKSNATSKTYEYVMKDGYKTKAKVYSGSSYKAIMSAHPTAKAIRITKNGQKFCNSVHNPGGSSKVKSSCSGNGSTKGDRVYFSDYVGSNDSHAGTSSATFYWDAGAKTWRKGNCGNPVKFTGSLPKLSVKQITIVRELSTTVSATVDYSLSRDVEAKKVCENDAVSAFGYGYASASASIHQVLTATAKSKAEASAKFAAAYLKLKQSLQQKVWLQASGSYAVKVSAKAQAGCTLKVQPPVPTPTVTVTSTPSPAPTQTVIVTPPPVVTTYIPVCEVATKKIVSVNQADYDHSRYTTDLTQCNVVTPPIVKIPVCRLADKQIVTINEGDFDASKYSRNVEDCKAPPVVITYIPVCDTQTKTIVSVNQADYDHSRYTTDFSKCQTVTPPPPAKITVCELSSKQIVTINESDFDASKYSKNLDDCKTVTPPPAVSTVTLNTKNDVDRSTVDPGTGKPDYSTAPIFFDYDLATDTAKVQVTSKFGGSFQDVPATVSKGGSRVNFTYVATSDPKADHDELTVNLIDPATGKIIATSSTDITINDTPVIPQ